MSNRAVFDLIAMQERIIQNSAQMSAKRRDIKLDVQYFVGKCGYSTAELVKAYKAETRDGRGDNLFKKVLLGSHIDFDLLGTLLDFARMHPLDKNMKQAV